MKVELLWSLKGKPRTKIWYNTMEETVCIKNYEAPDNIEFAFGSNTAPTIKDVEWLLKSRCLDDTRVDKKNWLNKLHVRSDAPLDFIRVTEGRMAKDHFTLQIISEEL